MSEVLNKYLKEVIGEVKSYIDAEKEVPLDLFLMMVSELKVSSLLVPAIEEEDAFTFESILSDDEKPYLPLFTDNSEFEAYCGEDTEFEPFESDFEAYVQIVEEESLEGIVINVESDEFPIDREVLIEIPFDDVKEDDGSEGYPAQKLKEIYESASNESLKDFISDKSNNDDFEGLMVELSNATLINLVVSEVSLDEYAENGIIKADDVDGFNLCTADDEDIHFAVIFTDKDAIEGALEEEDLFFYGQVTSLNQLFDFVLRNDMDGIVINPNSEEYYIPRAVILPQASGIELIDENPKLKSSIDYAFIR